MSGPPPGAPPGGAVHCWVIDVSTLPDDELSAQIGVLSADERDRARRFRFQPDRRHYLASHAALRLLLSRYTDQPAKTLPIVTDALGRPALTGRSSTLRFNLSHSGDLAMVAIAAGEPVGVDIEVVREFPNVMDIASSYFAPAEALAIRELPPAERPLAFTTTWTRKEAVLKALGLGLTVPLDAFDTGPPGQSPVVTGHGRQWANWTLIDLLPATGYVAAVAIQRPKAEVALHRFDWSSHHHRRRIPD